MYTGEQPRDWHGRFAGGGDSGSAKATIGQALDSHIGAVAETATEGHAFAAAASSAADEHLARGKELESGANTPEGARAANAEYAAHDSLKERSAALEHEASQNDRTVRDLGRARDALYDGKTERAASIAEKAGQGESDEHDSWQEDHMKTAPTGDERNSRHFFPRPTMVKT